VCAADVHLIMPHVPHIMAFIEQIAEDQEHPDAVVGATCGLIGSVLSLMNTNVLAVAVHIFIQLTLLVVIVSESQ